MVEKLPQGQPKGVGYFDGSSWKQLLLLRPQMLHRNGHRGLEKSQNLRKEGLANVTAEPSFIISLVEGTGVSQNTAPNTQTNVELMFG